MSDAQLVAAIEANPNDADAYLVYADWLQSRSDPRGELIVLHHQGKTDDAKQTELLGAFASFLEEAPKGRRNQRKLKLDWQLGFIKSAHIGWETSGGMKRPEATKSLQDFLALPSARFLQELTIGPVPTSDFMSFTPWVEALAELARPRTLRKLVVGDIAHWDISSTSVGKLDAVLAAFPNLRALVAHAGDITLGTGVEHAELRELAIQTGGIGTTIEEVCSAKLPKLERLELWMGTPNYGGSTDIEDLADIFDGARFPNLKHLGLMNAVYTDDIVQRLITSAILPRLTSLDLSMGTLSDDGVRAMLAAKHAFAHLDHLELEDNALTETNPVLFEGLAKVVHVGDRHDDDRIAEEALEDRYASVGE